MIKRFDGANWVDVSSVRRFNGSNWVDCSEVKRFDGSNWVDVLSSPVLYDHGNEFVGTTDGWLAGQFFGSTHPYVGGAVYKLADSMRIVDNWIAMPDLTSMRGHGCGAVRTSKPIDMSKFSYLYLHLRIQNAHAVHTQPGSDGCFDVYYPFIHFAISASNIKSLRRGAHNTTPYDWEPSIITRTNKNIYNSGQDLTMWLNISNISNGYVHIAGDTTEYSGCKLDFLVYKVELS